MQARAYKQGNTRVFLKMADKFINVDDLDINLIESINSISPWIC